MSKARLNGRITPNGFDSLVSFEWGKTSAYGNVTPTQPVPGDSSAVTFSHDLTLLENGYQYFFRSVETFSGGQIFGSGKSFTAPTGTVPLISLFDSLDPSKPAQSGICTFTRAILDSDSPLTVFFTVSGTAVPGVDYVALPAFIVFPPGQIFYDLSVDPLPTAPGPSLIITITLVASPHYILDTPSTIDLTLFNP